jgi:predicted phosphodiesterase
VKLLNLENTTNKEYEKMAKDQEKVIAALKAELKDYKGSEQYKLIQELENKKLNPVEIRAVLKGIEQGNPYVQNNYTIGKNHVKFGVLGDTHIGSKEYDAGLMNHAAKQFTKEGVDFVIHTGDIVDGIYYSHRPSQIYESSVLGGDAQIELAAKELKKIKEPLYFITGNHEYNTFIRNAGIEIGYHLERQLRELGKTNSYFLGNAEGDIKLKSGSVVRALHPDGGTAYAISYKSQKIIESLEGGQKPNVMLIGHFHKAEYIFYRNVHTFQTATLEGQTKFMKGKGIPAMKGFWIIDLYTKQGGQVDKIVPQFYPSYKD